jgi:hypothetical protein
VDCQLDVLKRCLKLGLIREALKNLPKTLDDTYSRVLMSIEEVYRDDAKHALMWLAFSERPLQLKELAEAMIINPHAPFHRAISRNVASTIYCNTPPRLPVIPANFVWVLK